MSLLYKRSLLKMMDLIPSEIEYLLNVAVKLKQDKLDGIEEKYIEGNNLALVFNQKLSTRTRSAFEVATNDQGANCIYLGHESYIGEFESLRDTARVFGKYYDGIQYRGFSQDHVEQFASYSGIPVYNDLTDMWVPTQVLSTFMTLLENHPESEKGLNDLKICYVGDARFNTCNSLLMGSMLMGVDFRVAAPKIVHPDSWVLEIAEQVLHQNTIDGFQGALLITEDVDIAVEGVDLIYTDVWVSPGESQSSWGERVPFMIPYQVNNEMLELTNNPNTFFSHCLPSFHNTETNVAKVISEEYGLDAMEVTDDVFESDRSLVFDEAANMVHIFKALMVTSLFEEDVLSL